MRKLGGIIALIGGICALPLTYINHAAIMELAHALGRSGGGVELLRFFGWSGMIGSALTIVLAVAILAGWGKRYAFFLILTAAYGAVIGASIGSYLLYLSVLGGILALFGRKKPPKAAQPDRAEPSLNQTH